VPYLPPYSPNLLDPIEGAFSKIKRPLRKVEARSKKALVGAVGAAALGGHRPGREGFFFEHRGYRQPTRALTGCAGGTNEAAFGNAGDQKREPASRTGSLPLDGSLTNPVLGAADQGRSCTCRSG
jgi:hypothetical protein